MIKTQNIDLFEDIDVQNLTQEEVTNLNEEIKKTNQALFQEYIDLKKQQIAQDFVEYITQLDKLRIESIKNDNFLDDDNNVQNKKEEIKINPADESFVEMLQNVLNYLESVEQMTKNCQKIDHGTQIRMVEILQKNKQILMTSKLQENWIFQETQDVQDFFADYFEILFSLRQDLTNLGGKSFLCSSKKSKGSTKINKKLDVLEMKFPGFQLLFKLKPRMQNHVTKIVGQKQTIPPPQMDIQIEDFEQLIDNILKDQHPEQIPLINLKIQNKLEIKENVKTVIEKQEKSNYVIGQEYFYGQNQVQDYQKAIEHFLLAEKQGIVQASNALGNMYFKGKGVQKDYTKAYQHFLKSANKQNADGLYYVGYMIENRMIPGFSDKERINVAKEYYEKASTRNQSEALTDLAFLHENGLLNQINEKKAIQLYEKAITLKNPRAMNNLASLLLKTNLVDQTEGQRRAFDLFKQSSEMNYLNGTTNLAICFLKGLGVTKNYNKAKELFEQGALQNDPDSIFHLAYFKLKEANNYQDQSLYHDAIELLRKTLAFNKNHSDANYYLGYVYENGLGVSQDYKTAYNYYHKASESSNQNNSKALFKLANLILNNQGVDYPNQQQAIEYLKKGAQLRDADALNKLGELYEQGNLVKQDFQIAKTFYEQAIDKKSSDAKVNLAFLMKNNTLKIQTCNQEGVSDKLLYEAAQSGNQRAQNFLSSMMPQKRQFQSFYNAQQYLTNKENEFQTLKLYQNQNKNLNIENSQNYNFKYVSQFIKI